MDRDRRESRGKTEKKVIEMAEQSFLRMSSDVVDRASVVYSNLTGKRAKVKDVGEAAFEFYIKYAEHVQRENSVESNLRKTGTEN